MVMLRALAATALVFLLAFPGPEAWGQRLKRGKAGAVTEAGQEITYLKDVEKNIIRLTNEARRQNGLSALTKEQNLTRIARAHSEDMLVRDYFGHVSPEGGTPSQRITAGYPYPLTMTGENVWGAAGTHPLETERMARIIVDTWMSSAGHRQNILQPSFTDIGVGVAASGKRVRATQVFIQIKK